MCDVTRILCEARHVPQEAEHGLWEAASFSVKHHMVCLEAARVPCDAAMFFKT